MIQSKPFGTEDRPAVLRAFDAANVGRELWTSEQNAARDRAGVAPRFTTPAVCGGRVYVGTRGGVDVYGLRSPAEPGALDDAARHPLFPVLIAAATFRAR